MFQKQEKQNIQIDYGKLGYYEQPNPKSMLETLFTLADTGEVRAKQEEK